VKYLKTSILAKLVNPNNAPDIVGELAECVANTDTTLSRLSVEALAHIACRDVGGEGCAENITVRLVEMVDLDIPHVSSEAATALAAIFRKHPRLREVIAPPLPRALRYMTEDSGKTSIIYLLGECGDIVSEAPYCLEKLIDSYEEIKSADIKIALLTSTMKLFFQRPPEVQLMLGRLLQKATEDLSSQDLHDRALLYYRLLRTAADPNEVKDIIATNTKMEATNFSEENFDGDIRDELMQEFNSLSIVYGTTSDNFIAEENQVKFVKMPAEHPLDGGHVSTAPINDYEQSVDNLAGGIQEISLPVEPAPAPVPVAPAAPAPEIDLLGFGTEPTPAPIHEPVSYSSFTLNPNFSLSGDEYQSNWSLVPDAESHVLSVPLSSLPPSTGAVEGPLAQSSIKTMASGELPTELKFFLYAQDTSSDGSIILVQASIGKGSIPTEMLLTIKVSGPGGREKADAFVDILKTSLTNFA